MYVGFVINVFFLLPILTVTARRLHDVNRSGWWQVIMTYPTLTAMFVSETHWDYLEITGYDNLNAISPFIIPLLILYFVVGMLSWFYWSIKKGKAEKNIFNR